MPNTPDVSLPIPEPVPVDGVATGLVPPAADAEPQTMQRRLWWLLPVAAVSLSVVWGGVLQALIALQIQSFTANKATQASTLGTVLTFCAVASVVFLPIVGRLGDRTPSRFIGRRNLWIFLGSVAGAILLVLLSFATNAVYVAVVWALALFPLNGVQQALQAIVPERVPVNVRARLTSLTGVGALVGVAIGAAAGLLIPSHLVAYAVIGVQLIVVCSLVAFLTRDYVPPAQTTSGPKVKSDLLNIRKHPDFWLVFAGRFLAFVGYNLGIALQLFAVRDHFGAGAAAQTTTTAVLGVSTLVLLISSVAGGFLSDKTGRMKPFVIGASVVFIPAGIVLAFVPTLTGAFIGFALLGLGFGAYVSVDGALITRVLPRLQDAGRDLGVLGIANSGPQVVAPAIAGALVASLGYPALYILVIVAAAIASVIVGFVRSVR